MIEDMVIVLVVIIWLFNLWRMYLFKRQLSLADETDEVPETFRSYYSPGSYRMVREELKGALSALIFVDGIQLFIKTVSLTTPYHSCLWSLTSDLSDGARPSAFAALHTIVTRMCLIPFVMLAAFATPSSRNARSPIVILIVSVLQVTIAAMQAAMLLYAIVFLIDTFGAEVFVYFSLARPIVELFFVTLTIAVIGPLEMQNLNVLEIAGLIEKLAERAGFRPSNIYVNSNDIEPNASYAGMLGFSVIIVTQELTRALNPGEVCAAVAHELGHWAYGFSTLEFLTYSILRSQGFMFSTYGMSNDFAYKLFTLSTDDDRPHLSVPIYLGLCYVWPVIRRFLSGVKSCFVRHQEFQADEYAVRLGYSTDLKTALLSLYERTGEFPVQDKWYSAWFTNHPTLTERLQRIDNKT